MIGDCIVNTMILYLSERMRKLEFCERLKRSEAQERAQAVLDSIPSAVILIDPAKEEIVAWNQGFE